MYQINPKSFLNQMCTQAGLLTKGWQWACTWFTEIVLRKVYVRVYLFTKSVCVPIYQSVLVRT